MQRLNDLLGQADRNIETLVRLIQDAGHQNCDWASISSRVSELQQALALHATRLQLVILERNATDSSGAAKSVRAQAPVQ